MQGHSMNCAMAGVSLAMACPGYIRDRMTGFEERVVRPGEYQPVNAG
jgi:hypothetical protein